MKFVLITCLFISFTALAENYKRKLYPHWIDQDRDCQNSRAEILIKENKGELKFKRNKSCNVTWGSWYDPYSGKTFTKASDLDIDHIVPLKHAHTNGANEWTRKKRRAFANDPLNLIPVSKRLNRQKGAKGPTRWMPPNKDFQCEYIKRWKAVKAKYGIRSSGREVASIEKTPCRSK
jgi:5-methylcytosine-specific restriction endonuclease McrA